MTQPAAQELTLEDYVSILRRRWIWFLAPIVLLAAAATALGLRSEPQYTATATVGLVDSADEEILGGSSTNVQVQSRRIENEINFAKTDAVEARVEELLGFLPRGIGITAVADSDYLDFTATANTPEKSAEWANTWATAYVETKQNEARSSIDTRIAVLEDKRDSLNDEIARLRDGNDQKQFLIDQRSEVNSQLLRLELQAETASAGTAKVYVVASPPDTESGAPLWRTILLGIVAGGVLGVAAALAAESFDKTIKTADDITAVTGLPVLGQIPLAGRWMSGFELALSSRDHDDSPVADAYRRVATSLQFSLMNKSVNTLLITSANASEGKTTTSVNLAYALANPEMLVVLADVDFRKPRLHQALDVPAEPGLSNHIIEDVPLEQLAFRNDDGTMAVFTAGSKPPNPADFVATREFIGAVDALSQVADLVLLDAPPLLPVSDSLLMSRNVDGVVMVAAAGTTTKESLARAVAGIEQVGGNVIGVVLVGVKEESLYGQYGYGYYNQKEHAEIEQAKKEAAKIAGGGPSANGGPKSSAPVAIESLGYSSRERAN
ncbi:MAG: polysaccharide biosynthesis tyrosine autokinase [Acidimicrobiales bacterium]